MTDVGEFRKGSVIETNPVGYPDGSVEVEWEDGTRSVLQPKIPPPALQTWLESVERYGKCGDAMCTCQTINTESKE
jgi:hypothetical protein